MSKMERKCSNRRSKNLRIRILMVPHAGHVRRAVPCAAGDTLTYLPGRRLLPRDTRAAPAPTRTAPTRQLWRQDPVSRLPRNATCAAIQNGPSAIPCRRRGLNGGQDGGRSAPAEPRKMAGPRCYELTDAARRSPNPDSSPSGNLCESASDPVLRSSSSTAAAGVGHRHAPRAAKPSRNGRVSTRDHPRQR